MSAGSFVQLTSPMIAVAERRMLPNVRGEWRGGGRGEGGGHTVTILKMHISCIHLHRMD